MLKVPQYFEHFQRIWSVSALILGAGLSFTFGSLTNFLPFSLPQEKNGPKIGAELLQPRGEEQPKFLNSMK